MIGQVETFNDIQILARIEIGHSSFAATIDGDYAIGICFDVF
jgi:hypothetical protein